MRGGKCYGEGSYGKVCDVADFKMCILTYEYYDQTNNTRISTNLDYGTLLAFSQDIVLKQFKKPNAYQKEKQLLMLVATLNLPNTVLYTVEQKTSISVELGTSQFCIFKKMDGDLTQLPKQSRTLLAAHHCLTQCLEFLKALHQKGFCHYDIKPLNILYQEDTEAGVVPSADPAQSRGTQSKLTFALADYGFLAPATQDTFHSFTKSYISPLSAEYFRPFKDMTEHYSYMADSNITPALSVTRLIQRYPDLIVLKNPEMYTYINKFNDLFALFKSIHDIFKIPQLRTLLNDFYDYSDLDYWYNFNLLTYLQQTSKKRQRTPAP